MSQPTCMLPNSESKLRSTSLVLIIFALGLTLRMVGLGWESIWYDEADSLRPRKLLLFAALVRRSDYSRKSEWLFRPAEDVVSCFLVFRSKTGTGLVGNHGGPRGSLRLGSGEAGFAFDRGRGNRHPAYGDESSPRLSRERSARFRSDVDDDLTGGLIRIRSRVRESKRGWIGLAVTCSLSLHLHYSTFFFMAVLPIPILWSRRKDLRLTLVKLATVYGAAGLALMTLGSQLLDATDVGDVACGRLVVPAFDLFSGLRVRRPDFCWKADGIVAAALAEMIVVTVVLIPVVVRSWNSEGISSLLRLGRIWRSSSRVGRHADPVPRP